MTVQNDHKKLKRSRDTTLKLPNDLKFDDGFFLDLKVIVSKDLKGFSSSKTAMYSHSSLNIFAILRNWSSLIPAMPVKEVISLLIIKQSTAA